MIPSGDPREFVARYLFRFPNGCAVVLTEATTGTEIWYSLGGAQGFSLDWPKYVAFGTKDDPYRRNAIAGANLTSEEINFESFFSEFFDCIADLSDPTASPMADFDLCPAPDMRQWPSLPHHRIGVPVTCLSSQLMPFNMAAEGDAWDLGFRQFTPEQLAALTPLQDKLSSLWLHVMQFGAGEYLRGGFLSHETTVSARKFVDLSKYQDVSLTPPQIRTIVNNLKLPPGFVLAVEKIVLS